MKNVTNGNNIVEIFVHHLADVAGDAYEDGAEMSQYIRSSKDYSAETTEVFEDLCDRFDVAHGRFVVIESLTNPSNPLT